MLFMWFWFKPEHDHRLPLAGSITTLHDVATAAGQFSQCYSHQMQVEAAAERERRAQERRDREAGDLAIALGKSRREAARSQRTGGCLTRPNALACMLGAPAESAFPSTIKFC